MKQLGARTSLKRRLFIGLLFMLSFISALLWRLFHIQVLDSGSYSSRDVDLVGNSVAQRETGVELDSGRGQFYDRHGTAITGERIQALVVFPMKPQLAGRDEDVEQLIGLLGTTRDAWNAFYTGLLQPKLWTDGLSGQPKALTAKQVSQIQQLALPGVKVFETVRRYPDHASAKHLIGYIGENPERIAQLYTRELQNGQLSITSRIGVAGLEKTLESYLQGVGHTSISQFTDAESRPLPGLETRQVAPDNPYYPLQAITTLDLPMQRDVEAVLAKLQVREGAVVVLDAANADVLAMASRPDYDPLRVDPAGGAWSNRALKAFAPGSIFKTVVAAAALDEGVVKPDEHFRCDGFLGKYGFTCWLKSGHGSLTLEQAFAVSCNVTFARVAERLTGSQLQAYADKLGLDQQVGWTDASGRKTFTQFDSEEAGQIFDRHMPSDDEGVRVQTAIGQRDVLVSPLQAANLVVTLLNRGEVRRPRVIESIRFRNGATAQTFSEQVLMGRGDGISATTAKRLTQWMQDVVQDGTGKALQQAQWHLAGKSGTAEVTVNGKPAVNQWFIGYGPVERPAYAVAVVVPNASEREGGQAVAVFRGVMDALARYPSKMSE
ncbi:peptidoglycan D,D-transpeptidase FtsI family protein [Paenibacillus sp. HJGM_3]|uniref:peptidoglycan D,D-transpeptidase FtsI family protein n=1 Tax=Paenibacillus sp. HJGM_3 TaxID=3379816 RepID=UPI00385A5C28